MSVSWDPIYSVHVRVIDAQHKRYIAILSELDDAVIERRPDIELGAIFNELKEYTDVHFSTEEMYFDRFGYEHAAEHKAAHAKFRQDLTRFQGESASDPGMFSRQLVDYLHDWLAQHIAHADKGYEKCFHDHGLT